MLEVGSLEERLAPGTRWLHWAALWDAVRLEPWTGYGWQQVTLAQQQTALAHAPSHEMIQNSHNIVLDLLLWNGAVLGGAVSIAVIGWFVTRVRRCDSLEGFVLIAVIGVIGTHALLEYPLDYAYLLLPFGIF